MKLLISTISFFTAFFISHRASATGNPPVQQFPVNSDQSNHSSGNIMSWGEGTDPLLPSIPGCTNHKHILNNSKNIITIRLFEPERA